MITEVYEKCLPSFLTINNPLYPDFLCISKVKLLALHNRQTSTTYPSIIDQFFYSSLEQLFISKGCYWPRG